VMTNTKRSDVSCHISLRRVLLIWFTAAPNLKTQLDLDLGIAMEHEASNGR
jgi:hypothetical protein